MRNGTLAAALSLGVVLTGCASHSPQKSTATNLSATKSEPIVIGQSFVMDSTELKEPRRITVYLPPGYAESTQRYPVLFLLDGGAAEDFHHITGIVQVSVANAIMDPIIVIGIENTERRRDLTGPTENAKDKTIAPHVGGSAAFRAFLTNELLPRIERDYRGNGSRALMGESLAGLFVLETFFDDPAPFENFISVSPSLWWNDEYLLKHAEARLKTLSVQGKTLYLTVGGVQDSTEEARKLADIVRQHTPPGLTFYYAPLPSEAHNSSFHIGALNALRLLYARKADTAAGG